MILWNDSVNVECGYPPVHNLAIVVMQCAKEALSFAINSYCDYFVINSSHKLKQYRHLQ